MRVSELIEKLKTLPADALVIQSRDEEGNGYLPTQAAVPCLYLPERDMVWPADDDTPLPENHSVVCLWPKHDWQQHVGDKNGF